MRVMIIDGYNFVFRAFHSLPPLTREDGTPIGAVYGFTNMLLRFIEQHSADYIVIALDSGKKNFRSEIYPEYKAHRPPVPPEIVVQFPIIREAIAAFGIKTLEMDGVEADDLIASYAKYAVNNGLEVRIVSGDKDLMQLIEEKVSLYDPMRNKIIGAVEVKEKFGVNPDQIKDYLSLVGDASDNIPGVKGIGSKTAAQLLETYHSLDGIYENLEDVMPLRRKQLLTEGREDSIISQQLVSLKGDIAPQYSIEELTMPDLISGKLLEFVQQQGFKALVSKLSKISGVKQVEAVNVEVQTNAVISLTAVAELEKIMPQIWNADSLAIHLDESVFYIAFSKQQYQLIFSKNATLFDQDAAVTLQQWMQSLAGVLHTQGVRKICFDSKRLYKLLHSFNIELVNVEDIAALAYCLETGRGDYSLPAILKATSDNEILDAQGIMQAYKTLQARLVNDKLTVLYNTVDKPLNIILAKMEIKGVRLDSAYLAELSKEFQGKLNELSKQVYDESGCEFNIASPKQLGEVLFEKMGLPGGKKVKSGAFVTDVDALENLEKSGFAIARKVLEWRQFAKLISTYTESLPKFINRSTSRIHTSFNPTATSTGRLSSQDPNLQNIPTRTLEGNKIRRAFIAAPGHVLLSADYSQIELRLLAHMADVEVLKQAFQSGKDIHLSTASQIFNIPMEQVDNNLRRQAKAINFGIIYGISAFGLSNNIGVPVETAKRYIEAYFKQYPGIKQYMEKTIVFAREHGYVNTIMKRKCLIQNINSSNYNLRNFAERASINAPLQGSNADIIKKAMARLGDDLQQYLILQIHDELLFEVPYDMVAELQGKIKQIMENVINISVPLPVEIKFGASWAEAH